MPAARAARVAAQAKVNLFLRVGPRRADGFHDILTMLQLIDLSDEIIVRVGGAGRTLHVAGPRLPNSGLGPTDRNLAFRAAVAYADRAGWPSGFSVELNKHVPTGGGLGGGSSDAGAVLRALDTLNERPLGRSALLELAAGLGSDVPFFVCGSARALASGRGEELGELDPLPAREALLLVPTVGVATADAYRWLDEVRTEPTSHKATRLDATPATRRLSAEEEWDLAAQTSHNDFEEVVEAKHPYLRALRAALDERGAFMARLAGSGSTVFGLFKSRPPMPASMEASPIHTRTSTRVVPVEVLE
jgi:4-diphosphocytidyl-2-C-methyl-D-erythritol kinase